MAEEEKKEEESAEVSSKDLMVIPMKYIGPMIIGSIILGSLGKIFLPGVLANFGPAIIEPFTSILWAYGAIIVLLVMTGDKKSGRQIIASVTPLLVFALVLPTILGFSYDGVIAPVVFMALAPFIGNFLRGGIKAAGAPAGARVETWRKEWLEEDEEARPALREGDIAAVRDAARVLVQETT